MQNVTHQHTGLNDEDTIYSHEDKLFKIKTFHDLKASGPDRMVLKISAALCNTAGKVFSDKNGEPLVFDAHQLIIYAHSKVVIAEELATMHQTAIENAMTALDHADQVAAIPGVAVRS